MRKNNLISIISLAILFTLCVYPVSAAAPSQANQAGTVVKLIANNKTGANVYLRLTGTQYYYFTLGGGKTKLEVEKGEYEYSYFACGAYQTGTLKVKQNNQKFTLESCAKSSGVGSGSSEKVFKLIINNKSGTNLYLVLTGTAYYSFSLGAGKTKVEVKEGEYDYSYYACGAYQEGTLKVKKNSQKLTLEACPGAKEAKDGKNKLIKVKLVNKTGGNMTMYIYNDTSTFTFTFPTGKTSIELPKGEYNYSVWGFCGRTTGNINIKKKTQWTWYCIK